MKAFLVKVPAAEAGLEVVETTRAKSGFGEEREAEDGCGCERGVGLSDSSFGEIAALIPMIEDETE